MLKKIFKKKILIPIEEEAVNEAITQIRKKFVSMQKETITISSFVLLMIFLFPLIFSENIAKIFTGTLLWGVFIYSIYHIYESRKDIFHFLKVRSLEKFIYQKIYDEVRKEIDSELHKKSTTENIIFNLFSEGKASLSHQVSSKAHSMSRSIISKNLIIIGVIVFVYNVLRNYLAYQNYHLSIIELMTYQVI